MLRPWDAPATQARKPKRKAPLALPAATQYAEALMSTDCQRARRCLRLLVTLLVIGLAATAKAQTFGHCKLYGSKGTHPFMPAIPGQLTVETGLPAPGWWNGESPDTIRDGYEYCMAANIAYRAGLDRLVVVNVSFAQLLGGQTRKFDLALTQATITEERRKAVDFSIPYFASDQGVLVRTGTKVDSEAMRHFRIGVQGATTSGDFVSEKIKPVQPLRVYPGLAAAYAALASGQIDAVLYDTAEVLGQAAASHGTMTVAAQYSTGENYGAIFPKGSANATTLNRIIQSLKDDGTLAALSAQYLAQSWGVDPTHIPYLRP